MPASSPRPRHALQAEVDRRLRAAGQRPSSARRLLVWALAEIDRPRSVTELLDDLPGVAQSSVYRNLRVLAGVDVVTMVVTPDESARWELAESLTQQHHHHLLCRACGMVLSYEPPSAMEEAVVQGLAAVAAAHDFTTEGHRLDLVGQCRDCRSSPSSSADGVRSSSEST